MKKKKNITITINPVLFKLIDDNFDNKSKVIEWFIINELSKIKMFKKQLNNIEL